MSVTSPTRDFLLSLGLPQDLIEDPAMFRHGPRKGQATAPAIQSMKQLKNLQTLLLGRRSDCIRMHRDSRELVPRSYCTEFIRADVDYVDGIDISKVIELVQLDATAVIANLEQWEPAVHALTSSLSDQLDLEVQAHLFCTAALSQGLRTHFDTEDNFLLQLEGSKRWQLWSPSSSIENAPDWDIELHEGQTLYIPIGWWHRGCALESVSTHITYQIVPKLLAESAAEAISERLSDLPIVEQVELLHGNTGPEALLERLARLKDAE